MLASMRPLVVCGKPRPAYVRAPSFRGRLSPLARANVKFRLAHSSSETEELVTNEDKLDTKTEEEKYIPPWSTVVLKKGGKKDARFRQHVNPLARRFQMQTDLPDDWPNCDFDDLTLPLYVDIGCGKGGFLLDLAAKGFEESSNDSEVTNMNYLGLEIRPSVAKYAQDRVAKRGVKGRVSFIGCNANVDLDRILSIYSESGGGPVSYASIQYPDPHFKKAHKKRRVVTPELVNTLAKYIPVDCDVFIQSDIKDVFDDMREKLREHGEDYFHDVLTDFGMTLDENPIGVPTEREVSVLDQGLPVYRTIFRRNEAEIL
eukprot:CAMPEP_0113528856 /NCGR_PEP_ID=MMETSP0015_2-20120614/2071_1 /TAXON_ID=2838 /ORGANISM="Odontella" /LENGTH=315 /DNA_ID=CAMNT_0000427423 /DNA_START=205 /DNA_END=1152 /DNA_ORIENTATION=+ /assembly_acc=CAM_ASM_000160